MVKTTDEGTGKSEIRRADELVRNEAFRVLVETAIGAHSVRIKQETGNTNTDYDEMSADVRSELAELKVVELLLLDEREEGHVRYVMSYPTTTYIRFASKADTVGERLKLFGPPKREEGNPIWQLSIRVSRPNELDPYRHSPEEIVIDTPEAVITIMPERVYLDDQETTKSRPGTGVTVNLYEGGRAEIFGAKGVGNILYTTEEPITVLEDPEISAMIGRYFS